MEQKNEILEISLTDIKPEKLLNYVPCQELFQWAFKKIFLFRFASFLLIADFCILLLSTCADIYFKAPISIIIQRILLLILLACLLLFIHTLSPKISYKISFKINKSRYEDNYTVILRKDGLHRHAQKNVLVPWEKHRIVEGKYGIAILSFYRIIALIPKDDFPPEGYEQIRRWCSLK